MKSLMTSIAAAGLLATAGMAQTSHPSYSIQDLGAVGGAPGAPNVIKDNGLIVGAAATVDNKMHAAVWFMGFKADLGTPALGGPNSVAFAVNSLGQAAGTAQTMDPNSEDFCGFNAFGLAKSSTACLPFIWKDGVMTKLPTLGGANGAAIGMNNQGEVAGYAETANRDPNPACKVAQFLPVVWGKGGATQLKTPAGDPDGVAWSINDQGQAVGASGSCQSFNVNSEVYLLEKHALLWQNGTMVDLGNLGGTGTLGGIHACAINNRGQAVGHSDLAGDTTFHGFVWTWETGMRDIGTLPGDSASLGLGINDKGVTVGASLDQMFNPRAIIFENGDMIDLNAVVSSNPQKVFLLLAGSINSHGQIVGFGVTPDGNLHGFMATPDTTVTRTASFENATNPAPLSDDARNVIFRKLGIPAR
jgi:probable HAF family extracellular repeat protein